jgi:16S rRNA (cytosine967-C5)-methyltransferase
MRLPSLLGHSAQLLRLIEHSPRPADVLASEYFRSKKYIGAKERRFIAQAVFSALRGHGVFAYCAHEALKHIAQDTESVKTHLQTHGKIERRTSAEMLFDELGVITACCLVGNQVGVGNMFSTIEQTFGIPYLDIEGRIIALGEAFGERAAISPDAGIQFAGALFEYWSILEQEIENILNAGEFPEPAQILLSKRYATPRWIMEAWQEGTVEARDWFASVELAASLLGAAPLSLRVNMLGADREAVLELLREDGVTAKAGRLSPHCITTEQRVNLTSTNLYREGTIEIQDEASQLAGFGLAPHQGWRVLDACAGAGGKSLHIGVLQKNRGEIIASDIEYQRLKELPIRAKRSGITSIRTVQLNGKATPEALPEQLERVKQSCDAVIIDAPCSGMGTVRRMPMTKWRLTPELLRKHGQKQLEIVQSFAHAVKKDGILLYSTCSLMPQENQQVVRTFLDQNPDFAPEALAPAFAENGIRIPMLSADAAMLTLTPAQHGTDGFFMARLRRKE